MTNTVKTTPNRGLAALIPTGQPSVREREPKPTAKKPSVKDVPASVDGLELISVDPDQVVPNPRQPRHQFDPDAITELATSLKEVGFLQPIVVRRGTGAKKYELVAGERRWRAAKQAGFKSVPALLRTTEDDELLREALLENLQRVALNPLEEAAAYQQLLTDFGGTHDELAGRLGKSRPQISNTLRLLKLPSPVQNRVAAGVLSAGHARALLALESPDAMDSLAKRVVAEGISVRGLEEIVAVGAGGSAKPARSSRTKKTLPELDVVAARLGDLLDTRVQVSMGKSRGKITIEFSGIDDLHRIVTSLDG